jgi:putative membrane protein
MYYNYGPGPMGAHNWGIGVLMGVFFLIFIAIVALIVIRLLNHHDVSYRGTSIEGSADPLNIVKQRYAKGEIKKEEYQQLLKDLK